MKRRHGINTSRTTRVKQQPLPLPPPQPPPPSEQLPLYEDSVPPEDLSERTNNHFFNPPPLEAAPTSSYMAPHPNAMLSYYNFTQIQTTHIQTTQIQYLDPANGAMDVMQHR